MPNPEITNSMSETGIPADKVEIPASGEKTATESAAENKQNGDNPSQKGDESKNTSGENSQEKTDTTDNPDDENLPFHKHPRFKELTTANKSLTQSNKQMAQAMKSMEEKLGSFEKVFDTLQKNSEQGKELDPRYVEALGNDKVALGLLDFINERIESVREAAKQDVLSEVTQKEKQQQEAITNYQTMIDERFDEMEADGLEFDRDEVLKFAKENATDGYLLDFRVALKFLNQLKTAKKTQQTEEKKNNASFVSSKGSATGDGNKPKLDPQKLRKASLTDWRKFLN